MPRRVDIELTSRTEDDTFTWRAAGARHPRGTVAAGMVPEGSAVGDVVRAEVESGLDGLEIVSLVSKSEKSEDRPTNRIEVIGVPQRGPDVSISYAPGAKRRRTGDGPGRPAGGRGGARTGGRVGSPGAGQGRPGRGSPRTGERRPGERPSPGVERGGAPGARRERRAPVSMAHRNALLATLGPQELPVAEQMLRGGIPAVRQAIAEHGGAGGNGPATANAEAVLAVADGLLPKVNLASWKDRASAAQAAGRDLRLRELRAVVTSSRTVTLDEEARAMAKGLREALDQRVTALRDEWITRITKALEDGRLVDALSASSRSPEPATRLPADLAVRLAEAAGTGMTSEDDPDVWRSLLEAVIESPVRRTVKPTGIPGTAEAQEAARRAAGSVPELAKLLGLRIPPPPPRRAPSRRSPVMADGGGGPAGGR
ncbi:MAG: hypothetical protein ACRDY3_09685 [Acidimicrobiales bacterium]